MEILRQILMKWETSCILEFSLVIKIIEVLREWIYANLHFETDLNKIRTAPAQGPYEFFLPRGARRVLMHTLQAYL